VARIFLAEWTGLSLQSEHPLVPMLTQAPMGRGSRPAGNVATVGLRRWRRMCRRNQRDRLMSHSNILTNIASTTQPKRTAKRRKLGPALRRRRTSKRGSSPCSGILKAQRSRRFLVTIVLRLGWRSYQRESIGHACTASPPQMHPSSRHERSRNDAKRRSMDRARARRVDRRQRCVFK
jgi:hypothetical protein